MYLVENYRVRKIYRREKYVLMDKYISDILVQTIRVTELKNVR